MSDKDLMTKPYVTVNDDGTLNLHNVPAKMELHVPTDRRWSGGRMFTNQAVNGAVFFAKAQEGTDDDAIFEVGGKKAYLLKGISVRPDFAFKTISSNANGKPLALFAKTDKMYRKQVAKEAPASEGSPDAGNEIPSE